MNFVWQDYNPETMSYLESWLDEHTVKATGLDEGFRKFYEYWTNEDGFATGENFWCKVVFEKDEPFAVMAFCQHESKMIIMEIVVKPEKRGQGKGSKLIKELLDREDIVGFSVHKSEAVIFPSNIASQKAFEKAGYRYHHTHKDGDALY